MKYGQLEEAVELSLMDQKEVAKNNKKLKLKMRSKSYKENLRIT